MIQLNSPANYILENYVPEEEEEEEDVQGQSYEIKTW